MDKNGVSQENTRFRAPKEGSGGWFDPFSTVKVAKTSPNARSLSQYESMHLMGPRENHGTDDQRLTNPPTHLKMMKTPLLTPF